MIPSDYCDFMELADILKSNGELPCQRKIYALILRLAMPAILAQWASVAMQYIDAAMVGSLGASATAAVSVVFSSIWIVIGLCYAINTGFSVQIAHAIGADDLEQAKKIFREGLMICGGITVLFSIFCIYLSSSLPSLLGAEPKISEKASSYFFIYACFFPIMQVRLFSAAALQCIGDTKTPGMLNFLLCLLDVIFNYFMILPTHIFEIGTFSLRIPGAGLGVTGAALGTAFSEIIIATIMFLKAFNQPKLHFNFTIKAFSKSILKDAVKISSPLALESIALNGTYIFITSIIAPIGTIALAANIFGITTEQICSLPGIGISVAATTLIGQALGAHRKDLARKFAWATVKLGIAIAIMIGIVLYVFAPSIFACLTPDAATQELSVIILRIELFSEPLFAAALVIGGILRGAKDTFVASTVTLSCLWLVFIPLALLLVKNNGLVGIWIAFCVDFCVRGLLLLLRLRSEKSWMKYS